MATVSRPVAFSGTDAEREHNRRSHAIDWEEGRCWSCDCRWMSKSYDYPCGAEVPRETIEVEDDAATAIPLHIEAFRIAKEIA